MSWWVYLNGDDGKSVAVSHHIEGGTRAIGGITEAELNITYNYAPRFAEAGVAMRKQDWTDGLFVLDGSLARDAVPFLSNAVEKLGVARSDDYWESTAGNAGYALSILRRWAVDNPEARFEVS